MSEIIVQTSTENEWQSTKGFKLLQVYFDVDDENGQLWYLKPHKLKKDLNTDRPQGRTLFVNNVPPYCTEDVVGRVFARYGNVTKVELCAAPGTRQAEQQQQLQQQVSEYFQPPEPVLGFRCAYVVFKRATGVFEAMRRRDAGRIELSTEEHPIQTGLTAMLERCRAPAEVDYDAVQDEIKRFMLRFDEQLRLLEEEAKAREVEPDEDGWTVVSKKKGLARTEVKQIKTSQRAQKRQKQMELVNFYSFQMRETKREQLAELRKKFEADKQRIALMRSQRKFRPY